jgi:hypothetical protein
MGEDITAPKKISDPIQDSSSEVISSFVRAVSFLRSRGIDGEDQDNIMPYASVERLAETEILASQILFT